ncbi:twin-arginine translocase subunit TatC [Streptacidiphilus sp. ASG 303]|uniref:twin-arginine translocase subunit TatC n=1 Tax=Streptomycetaceae TaxID=2062 RepID=UPI001E61326C|nr:twin-arginine translocase subunit TatC [Streptacidiphilus sp. ASG 303]MCD0481318.1 twin-arginine translocase subunit TatC [Streptacidiphilus sp. ASG 303]
MSLGDHLRELRNRLMKAVGAILVVTIAAAFYYRDLIDFLIRPLDGCTAKMNGTGGEQCIIAVTNLLSPFGLAIKVSLTAGLIIASPVWLYQLWAFIAPGLHRHEKKYSLAFLALGIPLFLGGAWFAYSILPTTVATLQSFTPHNATNIQNVDDFLNIATRMVIVFGLSFELPLVLIMLNFGGVLSARRMGGWWRGMVMGITLFTAIATPTTDPVSMLLLAGPILLLYVLACAVAWLNDRRRGRARAADPNAGLDDEEASVLDLAPAPLAPVEHVGGAAPLLGEPGPAEAQAGRAERFDDVT